MRILNSFVDDCEEAIRNLEHVAQRRLEEAKERARLAKLEQECIERERLERER